MKDKEIIAWQNLKISALNTVSEDYSRYIRKLEKENKELKEKWKIKFDDSNRNWNELVTDWVKDLEREITELKEKLAGAERTRDNLRQIGFPTFQSCKEYADKMNYAKAIIKDLLDNSDEYARQRAMDFLKEI